jgi:hypothetical protein
MIGQYLSNNNEKGTVPILQKILHLNQPMVDKKVTIWSKRYKQNIIMILFVVKWTKGRHTINLYNLSYFLTMVKTWEQRDWKEQRWRNWWKRELSSNLLLVLIFYDDFCISSSSYPNFPVLLCIRLFFFLKKTVLCDRFWLHEKRIISIFVCWFQLEFISYDTIFSLTSDNKPAPTELISLGPCSVPKFFPKFHYAKRRFSITSKYRQMHVVLNVDKIKN